MERHSGSTAVALEDVRELWETPLLELVFRAAGVHRLRHDPRRVQRCTLLSIKTGGCPEDCAYCPQAARHRTPVEREDLALRQARSRGGGRVRRLCSGGPVSSGPPGCSGPAAAVDALSDWLCALVVDAVAFRAR